MTGDFIVIGDASYVRVNKEGTLEKLPEIVWWRQLWMLIRQNFKPYSIKEVRDIAHGI